MKKAIKLIDTFVIIIFFLSVFMLILSGCAFSSMEKTTFDEGELAVSQNGRSARIGNVILYDCGQNYGTFIKLQNSDVAQKITDVSQNFAIDKISSSSRYFYLSGHETSDVWGGKSNVLVLDMNGKVNMAKNCCCKGIYACGSTVLGYYNDNDELDEGLLWSATRMEVTHYIDEEEFLNSEDISLEKWTPITGESLSMDGRKWFYQKDQEHSIPYYTDTVYSDTYDVLKWINYVDGEEVSGLDWDIAEKSKKYIEQIQGYMGNGKNNYEISSWQFSDKLFVICRVYSQSGGFLQHFTKDIECSMLFYYDTDKDSLSLENTFLGKELAYYDGNWIIYRKGKELFVENLHTHKVSKVFESDDTINIDLSGDVVTLWDIKNEELNSSNIFVLQ